MVFCCCSTINTYYNREIFCTVISVNILFLLFCACHIYFWILSLKIINWRAYCKLMFFTKLRENYFEFALNSWCTDNNQNCTKIIKSIKYSNFLSMKTVRQKQISCDTFFQNYLAPFFWRRWIDSLVVKSGPDFRKSDKSADYFSKIKDWWL